MIIKGIVEQIPSNGENQYQVRVPFLEDNTNNEALFNAILCNQPGQYYGYEVGDVVFIEFENNRMDTAIILGKLFTGETPEAGYYRISNLEVVGTVKLPPTQNDLDIKNLKQLQNGVSIGGGGDEFIPYVENHILHL